MIVSAFPTADGIQVNRQIAPDTLSSEMVWPGDAGWAEAVAAAAGFEVAEPASAQRTVEQARAAAIASINAVAGEIRTRFITVMPGQEMVYLAKEAEAVRFLAEGGDLSSYPLLTAEAGVTAPTPYELAQLWVNLGAMWRQVCAAIEAARIPAVLAAEQATTSAEADAAVAMFLTISADI